MRFQNIMKKAFIGGEWAVGYRIKGTIPYSIIEIEGKGWIADPFLFEYKNEHYLFVEYAVNDKGRIAYFKFIDEKPIFQETIISEPYHLSYPCVFHYRNEVYMIPESADHHTIDLYRAVVFPNKWEKIKTLEKGIYYDSTFITYNNKHYLISYTPTHGRFDLVIFAFDMERLSTRRIEQINYYVNTGRPAGNFFVENGVLFRPAQDCARKYGEKLLIYKVKSLDKKRYEEELEDILSAEMINKDYQRVHTYNRDSKFETVDLFKEKVDLLRPVKLIYKKLIQHN